MEVQTRNANGELDHFETVAEAFAAANRDKTIWKILWQPPEGRRVRLITRDFGFTWIYENILDETEALIVAAKYMIERHTAGILDLPVTDEQVHLLSRYIERNKR